MSCILADENVGAARIDDLVKLFLTSCRDWWMAAKDKLSGNEVDSSDEPTRKRKREAGSALMKRGNAKKKTAGKKDNSKDLTKESKSDGAAPTKGGKKKNANTNKGSSKGTATGKRKARSDASSTRAKQAPPSKKSNKKAKKASNQNQSTENSGQAKKKPFFISGSNYLSLLNIAQMKVYFGPSLREFWESIHEKYIQNIKGELKNMRHTNKFLATILRKVLRRMTLEKLIEDNPYYQKKQYARVDNFKIYKLENSDQEPSIVLTKNTAVSGIIDAQGNMLLCVEGKGQFSLHPVQFNNDGNGFWRYNLWYSQAEIGPVSKVCTSRKEVLELASDCFLMLRPIQSDTVLCQTVICRSWRVRNESGELALPRPNKETLLLVGTE